MNTWFKSVLCAGLLSLSPVYAEQGCIQTEPGSQNWSDSAQQKAYRAYLFANRLCDRDLFLLWPAIAQEMGYDFGQAIDFFVKVNAARALINLAAHEFDQTYQAKLSLVSGFAIRLAHTWYHKTAGIA